MHFLLINYLKIKIFFIFKFDIVAQFFENSKNPAKKRKVSELEEMFSDPVAVGIVNNDR